MDFLLDKIIVIILQSLFEQFMQDLAHSILKTQHSYLEAPSVKDQRQYNEINERAEQLRHILQWVNKKVSLFSANRVEGVSKPVSQYSFFMVKIESVNGLVFRKVSPHSKVFVTLIGKLYNHRTGQIYPKGIRLVRPLEEASTYVYELRDPFCFYLYTSCEKDLNIKVDVLLSEQEVRVEGTAGVFTGYENAGTIDIDFKQEHKGKQKRALILPNYFTLGRDNFMDSHMNSNATASIVCSKSDAFRYLERIVPQNVLCDSKDRIAGVMGYFLPLSENALADFAITPEAQSITFNFTSIEINSTMLKDVPNKAHNLVRNRFSNMTKVTSSLKDLIIRVYFHNSWKVISEASSLLHQKNQPNLKTNQSNISQLNLNHNHDRRKSKQFIPSLAKINDQARVTKGSFKNYSADEALHLKLVFPQEDQCVIVYQVVGDVVVRGEVESGNKKDASEYIEQHVEVPVCFGVNSAKAISNYRAMNCIMNSGGCLVSFNDLKLAIELGLKQINSNKRVTTSKAFGESKPKLPSFGGDFDIVSNNNRGAKTIGNISQVSTSANRGQIGFLQFQMQLHQNQEMPVGNQQNNSILQNFSSFNISKVEVKDKIQHEKERIVKEGKKNAVVKSNKIVVVQYSKGIVLSQQQRMAFGMGSDRKKGDKYYEKHQLLSKLNEMVNKYYSKETKQRLKTSSTYNINPITKMGVKSNPKQDSQLHPYNRVPYNINISNQTPSCIAQNRFSKYYELLYSNNWSRGQKNYYQYEALSEEIVKTELSQISYNNCFFINFIEVGSYSSEQPLKYPKHFYFKLKFYNRPQIRSQIMTINKDTGEILLLYSEETGKILHVEIEIDTEGANSHLRFIDFIQYLHNGMVSVEIVDYETGLAVGGFCVPLRGLVRKRRSEVVVQHSDVVYHNNGVKSTIKVEFRAIRKMRNKQAIAPMSPKKGQSPIKKQQQMVQKKPISQQNKQLNRIQRFKQQKSKKQSQIQSSSKIQSNQITKILDKVYSTQKQILHVTYLKKQFLFIEINNKTDTNVTYYCSINDQDKRWIQMNSLSLGSELTVVKDASLLEKDDYSRLTSTKKNLQKMMKCLKLNSQEQVELNPRAKGFLLLCYQTVRRFRDVQNPTMDRQLSIYNRQRKITCSIINDFDGCISVIHTIGIIPQPQTSEIQLQFYRPAEQQTLIHLPFLDSNYFQTGIDQILIDDPYAIVMPSNYMSLPIIDRFTSKGSGIYMQTSNDIKMQGYKEYHILVLNDVAKKQAILQESRKNQKGKSRTKMQSRLVQEVQEAGSPKLITMTLRVWGCFKMAVDVKLWEEKMGTINLSNHMFKAKGVQYFFLASEDQDTLTFSQDRKKKHQSLQLLKVAPDSATTQVGYTVFSGKTNVSFISINAISAASALEQQESSKNKQFTYIQPFYRLVLVLTTSVPLLKQTLKINISRSAQGTIDQPFTYRSPANKKTQFRIYSSDGELVWVKGSDSIFMMESKSQRKITISFSARRILQRSSFNGVCEGVILGVKWEKGIDYFGLRFNVY